MNYTADRDQRAFVAVSTTYTYLRPHGNYNLYSWGPDQYVTGTGTTATIAPLARVESEIVASGDADWFRVQMQAGRTYQFDLLGEETNAGTLPRTKLELHAADGTLLMEDAGGGTGTNSRLSYTPETDGIRFISTQGESSEDVGTYVLTVNPLDDYRADKNTLGRMALR